ncbi:HSP90 family protein [Chondrinema litorale]|uniref:HSP90 family protein n=1 Tax=Chondrinema litorale TaxID=2994555 RepID=UPI002542A171|nr:HSP90 family protein [Chondrinema litorale]UZR95474.1 HSP90 family protein [Chondrinema litorale]
MSHFNFQVNLEGIIDILSNHLYSEEKVFIRELLQNATDAISARKRQEQDFSPEVQIEIIESDGVIPPQLIFEDNGIGLSESEVHDFLSSIGSSSKRDELSKRRQDFIGQFGIGLLSCFMITNEIIMITRSLNDTKAIEWRGSANGSYKVKVLEGEFSVGTKIYLTAKKGKESYFEESKLKGILSLYGSLLPYPVQLQVGNNQQIINKLRAPWERKYSNTEEEREAVLEYGEKEFGIKFLDYISLVTPSGFTKGVAYVLPHEVSPSSKSTHKVYLKNMLISEKAENMLPDWAFFVKCIINTENLKPTASRESFYEDKDLKRTRDDLGKILKQYLLDLEKNNPDQLKKLYVIHYHSMNTLALHDDEFFKIIIPYIPFETDHGNLTLGEFESFDDVIRHIPNVDEFRQVASIANAQGISIINSGYTYKRELLEKLSRLFPEKQVVEVNTEHFIERFEEPFPSEKEAAAFFSRIANSVLDEFKCHAILKKFEPANLSTLYSKDEFSSLWNSIQKSDEVSNTLWGGIMNQLSSNEFINGYSKLCFNLNSPLIKKLTTVADEEQLSLYVKVLYVQSLLLGHHPLGSEELEILSTGLTKLIDFGIK